MTQTVHLLYYLADLHSTFKAAVHEDSPVSLVALHVYIPVSVLLKPTIETNFHFMQYFNKSQYSF